MSRFHQFVSATLADGKVDDADVQQLLELMSADDKLDLDDVKLLVELYCGTSRRCAAFDDLFFAVLEEVMLQDGEVKLSEQFYLLKMLYSDREVCDNERDFLRKLKSRSTRRSPAFDALCETALHAPATNWSTGGR
jgi:hypothetical protein